MSEVAGADAASSVKVVTRWLDILSRGATGEWAEVVDDDLIMQVVFMPGGGNEFHGREANAAIVGEFWKSWKRFSFHDVEVHAAADDAELVFATAQSVAETAWGLPYTNTYIFRTKVKAGKVVEHREYFNPMPVLEVFKDHLPG